jgi:hypothetical protein
MYCELINIMGLSFENQQRVVNEAGAGLWGRVNLPPGYLDGSAFEEGGDFLLLFNNVIICTT